MKEQTKRYGNDHFWAYIEDVPHGREIAIWQMILDEECIIGKAETKYTAKTIIDALIAYKNTQKLVLTPKELIFLDFVKANCPEPYSTMATNAILWNDKETYNKLKNEFPVIYS